MMKETCAYCFLSLICFSLAVKGFALPKDHQVVSGTSEFKQVDPHTMEVRPSDQAIINYSKFDIGKGEKVRFIQNSSSSCVLNRVQGQSPSGGASQIFGSLESNGKVFLVNPKGIYFSPNSHINVGSFIASTLDISNTDFLQENYRFSLGDNSSSIRNEGVLNSAEGSIALISPKIQNLGSITARAGSVILTSGKHVTLDFTGDGLIQFSVEGNLKESLIEHLGDIKGSTVSLKIPTAKKAISEIVNLDGAREGDIFIEENGVIKFASMASIESKKVLIEAANLEIKGSIDVSNSLDKGGLVHLLGRNISLVESHIDASGALGGGEVLVGGEFQGKGDTPWASKVNMDKSSEILCNAYDSGDGGLVVLWSYDRTFFNGQIKAGGGLLGGDGGLVETSGQKGLSILTGHVSTFAPEGTFGKWLLDPTNVYINNNPGHPSVSSCSASCVTTGCSSPVTPDDPTCTCTYGTGSSDCRIDLSTISNSSTNVVVQAVESISMNYDKDKTSETGINMTAAGASLTFELSNPNVNGFGLEIEADPDSATFYINTNGGNITLPIYTHLWSSLSMSSNGGNIDIPSINKYGGQTDLTKWDLTIDAGGGEVTLNSAVNYGNKSLGNIIVSNASLLKVQNPAGNATKSISIDGALNVGSTPMDVLGDNISIQANGSSITMGNIGVDSSVSGNVVIDLKGDSAAISIGNVGVSRSPPYSFSISSGASLSMSSVTTTGGAISITPAITVSGNISVTSQGGAITYEREIFASESPTLTVDGGSGPVSIVKDLSNFGDTSLTGSTLTLGAFTGTGKLVLSNSSTGTVSGDVSISGDFTQTGSGTLSVGSSVSAADISLAGLTAFNGTMTASGGISFTAQMTVGGAFTANGGSVVFGNGLTLIDNTSIIGSTGITIGGDTNGAFDLILDAPLSSISLKGVGNSNRLSSFIITSAGSLEFLSIFTDTGDIDISKPSTVSVVTGSSTPTLSSSSGQILFGNALTTSSSGTNLVISSPAHSLSLPVLGSTEYPFDDISITGFYVSLNSNLITTGNVIVNNSGTFTVNVPISVDGDFSQTGSGSVSLANNVLAGGRMSFNRPITITSSIVLTGFGGMDFDGVILPNATGLSLTLNAGTTTIVVPESGSDTFPFSSLSITGGSVTLSSAIKASSLSISNSKVMNITTVPISLSGSFQQTGTSTTALEQNITATSVSFSDDLVLKADTITIIATAGGLSFKGVSESNSNTQTLNLAATGLISTSGTLSTNILSIPSAPMGISIGNYLTLTDACSITAPTGDISVGGDFDVTGANGTATLIATAGNITIGENVEVKGSSGVATLTANAGTVDIGNTLKATNLTVSAVDVIVRNGISFVGTGTITATGALQVTNDISSSGNFTIIAPSATFGNMTTTGGNISVDALVTIKGSSPVISTSGGDIIFTKSIIPASTTPDLTIDAGIGNVTLDALGSAEQPFDDIVIVGCEVIVGDYYNTGSFEVDNCAALTLPQKVLSAGRDFIQSGVGPVSLAYNIIAGQVLYFTGPVTILDNITLTGLKGIDFEGPIYAGAEDLTLTLNAPSSLVVLHDVGTHAMPFENVSIIGDTVAFKGSIRSSILKFNGAQVTTSSTSTEQLFNTVPKTLFFVPGFYSSWDNFSNLEFFEQESIYPVQNLRDGKLTYWVMTRRYQEVDTVPSPDAFKNVDIISKRIEEPISYEVVLVHLDQPLEIGEVKAVIAIEALSINARVPDLEQIVAAAHEIGLDLAKEHVIETSEAAMIYSAKKMEPIELFIDDKIFSGLSAARDAVEFKRIEVAAGFEIEDPTVVEEEVEEKEEKSNLVVHKWPFDNKVILEVIKIPLIQVGPREEEAGWGFFIDLPEMPFPLDLLAD